MINTAIPGWISLGLFLMWFMVHNTVALVALSRTRAMKLSDSGFSSQKDYDAFTDQLFFRHADYILAYWWCKALRAVLIYGSMGFFFIWLHFATL